MAIANNLLLAHNIPQHEALDVLLRWLSSTITTPKFLEKQAFPVEDMRLALERAVGEIVERLNPELFSYIELAWSREYRVDVDEEEMYAERTVEWVSAAITFLSEHRRIWAANSMPTKDVVSVMLTGECEKQC
jgi:hypothetical protein